MVRGRVGEGTRGGRKGAGGEREGNVKKGEGGENRKIARVLRKGIWELRGRKGGGGGLNSVHPSYKAKLMKIKILINFVNSL